jgi:stage II sporulation protein D
MNIKHEVVNFSGINKIYIYVEIVDEYEFGEELLKPDKSYNFLNKLKDYVSKKISFKKDDIAVLVVNGVLIGAISLGVFTNAVNNEIKKQSEYSNKANYEVAIDYKNKEDKDKAKELELQKSELNLQEDTVKTNETVATESAQNNVITPASTTTTAKSNVVNNTTKNVATSATITQAPTPVVTTPTVTTGQTIRLNTNGTVVTMNLEEYIVGVVAAEMPASFQVEALKAQAIAARTFAMKKTSEGAILLNSTSNQVYKSESQLKQMWGGSYTTYYNKIKSAVDSTKGLVLTYNGKYIDAVYHSMSNSKTELPKYVWGYSAPYLQSVSSDWDTKVSNFEVSTNVTYATLSSKLGVTINKNTEFKILSETVSGRVDSIKIGDGTYSGVKIRSLLGLRSTDFTIVKGDTSVTITTKGYGHGVGMSQYGANEAAKEGYTYSQILNHYYTGVAIVRK